MPRDLQATLGTETNHGTPAPFPPMTALDAEAIGFKRFNDCPHLAIDIPDGGFTLTTKSSDGKPTTFYIGVSRTEGPATFVDIQYHDAGATIANANGGRSPVFNMLTIGRGGTQAYDSRKSAIEAKPSIAVILLETARVAAPPKGKGEGEG